MNGVQEVYMYCGAHAEQVEDYIGRSRWAPASGLSPFSLVHFVRVADARSVGDVLRDLDSRSLVGGDFILVHGDLVSNIKLGPALDAHRRRREQSAANIMTTLLRAAGPVDHRAKPKALTPVFVVDARTQRLLHYDEMSPLQRDRHLALDPAVAGELSSEFEVRSDLIDAHIDICTPEVLALWSESFDYELPRRHFLHGVLKDWELNGKVISADIVDDGYAARASDLQMYDAISRDVLGRWTFPLLPENNVVPRQTYQRHARGLVMESGVSHAPDARVTNSVVGRGTTIGPRARIANSVVGRGCRIGADAVVENSFVWDGATIGDATTVSSSILADAVAVGSRCALPAGSLLSFGVRVGDAVSPAKALVLSALSRPDAALLGSDTNAGPYSDAHDDDELDDEDPARLQKSLLYSLAGLDLSTSSLSTLASHQRHDLQQHHTSIFSFSFSFSFLFCLSVDMDRSNEHSIS